MIKAVIFDMDGLMFDTERLAKSAWKEVGERFGVSIGEEVLSRIRGATPAASAQIFREAFGEGFDYSAAKAMRNAWVENYIDQNGVPVKPGLPELLLVLRDAGVRRAVVSASPRETVKKYLHLVDLTGFYDVVIGAEDIPHSKPAPDGFLAAARLLNVEPEHCLVLEDSANGLLAAYHAGMTAICIPDLALPEDGALATAAAVLPSLKDVIQWVQQS